MTNVVVGLSSAIEALRAELLQAIDAGGDPRMRFKLAPIELSLQVAVTNEAGGKIGWKVLGLGASHEAATMQTLNLRLEPVWQQEDGSYSSEFLIADQEEEIPGFGPQDRHATDAH
jgi:Trypsin-co-occurring domain 2